MTAPRRGLANERHSRLKLAIAALSVAGFAGGWAVFGSTNRPAAAIPSTSATTATLSAQPPVTTTPETVATRRPRQSRSS